MIRPVPILVTGMILSGCTIAVESQLPGTQPPIPAADPVLISDENTTSLKTKTAQPESEKTPQKEEKATKPPATPAMKQGQTWYIVKKGDTLFEVMRQTGVYWKDIVRLNHLQPPKYTIHPGQKLRVR